MPKISFVLPTYNRVAWVGECIQSLLDQTEKDIEIIVVNDASTDGTMEFLYDWAGKKGVKLINNSKNIGGGLSRNLGINYSSADIVAMCDDDDFYPNDHAKNIIRWFDEHPESELVNFPYMRVGYFGEHLEAFWGREFDHEAFKENGTVTFFANPTAAMRKKSVLEVGGYPAETEGKTDDIQFLHKWVEAGKKVDFDNRAFGCLHRVMPNSMMAKMRGWRPEWVGSK